MKLYLECSMGASGDMLMAALLELLPEKKIFLDKMNSLALPGVKVECVPAEKCGILGSHINVFIHGTEEKSEDAIDAFQKDRHFREHHKHAHENAAEHSHDHVHYSYKDICALIETLDLPEKAKADALSVYRLIGEAEAEVHGKEIEQIHFHEVGSLDAVADVVGCCLLFSMLDPDYIAASPVHVGSGYVSCSHGILPVPAPAAAILLKGIPIYGGKIKAELCTPTGAAILRHFVKSFGDMEPMCVTKIGYGMGKKDFEIANCLRAFCGAPSESADSVVEISCNLDDMTPEAIGAAIDVLFNEGALDVFTVPIFMKKNRPAAMLKCLCRPEDSDNITRLILLHTTTFGVRNASLSRNVLKYRFSSIDTPYGPIRVKHAEGYGIKKEKPEYEDVLSAAKKHGLPFAEVYKMAIASIEELKNNMI